MFTSFEHLMNFKGRKVKVFTSTNGLGIVWIKID